MKRRRSQRVRDRFAGEILGVGTREGTRIVVGNWRVSPYGSFADVMVERADGHRVLLAPTRQVAEYVAATYEFDEVRVLPVDVTRSKERFAVAAGPLSLTAQLGPRDLVGWALHLLPDTLTAQTWFSRVTDPIARKVLPGVRTHGTAGAGRYEFYGAHDLHTVSSVAATWQGDTLGALAPVAPAPRFGFASTPRRPGLTALTTTVVRPRH
jgi:hypothetical protein